MSNAELATSYAALILADDNVEITVRIPQLVSPWLEAFLGSLNTDICSQADKLNAIIKAANVEEVEPIWSSLFAKALEGKDVKDLLLNVGSGGGAAAAPAAGAGGAAAADAPAEAKKEEKEEEKEESDEDMGFGLFD
ncbi:MAG: 60S acidic ribosomal protein P1 [Chaenotheca gracillima]|nr:MAG: 60S acidic ribosomal protein P1 [Chaenotheca gracillima]